MVLGRDGLVDAFVVQEATGGVVKLLHLALLQKDVLGLVLDDALLLGVNAAVGFTASEQPFDSV
jgi:hypothetical protein